MLCVIREDVALLLAFSKPLQFISPVVAKPCCESLYQLACIGGILFMLPVVYFAYVVAKDRYVNALRYRCPQCRARQPKRLEWRQTKKAGWFLTQGESVTKYRCRKCGNEWTFHSTSDAFFFGDLFG